MTLAAELLRFDPSVPIEQAWTPPSSWYTSPDFHAAELERVLRCTWQPVARVSELAEPGAFRAGTLFGEPWVVVRDRPDGATTDAGRLRAFHNTCRHKGREVVQGSGVASELVCGYHAWCYSLDGRLKSAPRMAGIRDFERGAMSLVPMDCEVWGPWVWIRARPTAGAGRALVSIAPEIDGELAATGWDRLRYHSGVTWDIGCNWKVYIDNYLDGGYHIPHMHPSLDAQIAMETYRTDCFERSSIQRTSPRSEADARIEFDAAARIGSEALYAWIYPNFMLNRYGPCLDTNYVVPQGPDRCQVIYEFWFDPTAVEADDPFVRESIEQSGVTQGEDIAICESVQVGLHSSSYDRGRYAPTVEIGEHHFHRLLAEDLSGSERGARTRS